MIRNKLLSILLISLLLNSCGFKIVDKRKLVNFNIDQISTNGEKDVNFKLKNKLLLYVNKESSNIINVILDTKKNKTIKEKNIKNEITKYKIDIIINVKLINVKSLKEFEFSSARSGDYIVADKFSQTLNNEKKLIERLTEELNEIIFSEIIKRANDF